MSVKSGSRSGASIWTGVRDPKLSPIVYQPSRFSSMALPVSTAQPSRATSPPLNLLPFRFANQVDTQQPRVKSPILSPKKLQRPPHRLINDAENKDRRMPKDKISGDSALSSTSGLDDSFTHTLSSSFTSYEHVSSRDATPSHLQSKAPMEPDRKRTRGSILIAATDAISFLGRKRKSVRQSTVHVELPEVIDISAARRDEELEERERLREAAAHAIGLAPALLQSSTIRENSLEEVDEEQAENEATRNPEVPRPLEPLTNTSRPTQSSNSPPSQHSHPPLGRNRQGSVVQAHPTHPASPTYLSHPTNPTHSRSNSTPPVLLPTFPTTLSALTPATHFSSTVPKYYPPSSLRIFALAKQWKTRFMIMTSPQPPPSRVAASNPSYLHLFRSSGPEEKELERLEINEDSIVFVAEEEVGGRKNVIKVGGQDVGALRKELNCEEAGRTMWLLQMAEPSEAQRWIAAIKTAILSQRSMRAGLGYPTPALSGVEPRGDLDVMLSMRAQGIFTSPTSPKFYPPEITSPTQATLTLEQASSTIIQPARAQGVLQKSASTSAVSTIKGFFSSRPRSTSRAASVEHDRAERDSHEDSSHVHRGNSLLSILRSNSAIETHSAPAPSPSAVIFASESGFYQSPVAKSPIDRRIVEVPEKWSPNGPNKLDTENRIMTVESLQPPPRKRPWTYTPSNLASAAAVDSGMYSHTNGNASIAGSFGVGMSTNSQVPSSPTPTGHSLAPSALERAASLRSVSTFASVDYADRHTNASKRRSRQGALPKRLTPPSGPPPSIPEPQTSIFHAVRSQSIEEARSRTSSIQSVMSGKNLVPILPSFSKRASTSSAASVETSGTSRASTESQTHVQVPSNSRPNVTSRILSSHRVSIPPPQRPAPNFAPPPAPPPAPPQAGSSISVPKHSIRESITHRGIRLSLLSPKPPPLTSLPPRPDEQEYAEQTAGLPSYGDRPSPSTSFSMVQGSHVAANSPFPPPEGPLPPPPRSSSPLASRRASLKQRLRILSAPLPSVSTSLPTDVTTLERHVMFNAYPPSPIGEKITNMQNDPDFLNSQSLTFSNSVDNGIPSSNTIPVRRSPDIHGFFPAPDPLSSSPKLTSLSPPPRRGSRQIFLGELEETPVPVDEQQKEQQQEQQQQQGHQEGQELSVVEQNKQFITPGSSVHSLGFVSI